MRRNDPLHALLVLCRIESQDAKLRLMQARQGQAVAEAALQSHAEVMADEAGEACSASFAAWLPAARDVTERSATTLAVAEATLATARAAAAAAGLSEKAVKGELLRRDRAHRSAQLATEQQRLGDLTQRNDDMS